MAKDLKSLLAAKKNRQTKADDVEVMNGDEVLVEALSRIDEVVTSVQESAEIVEHAASVIVDLQEQVKNQDEEIKRLKELKTEDGDVVKEEVKSLTAHIRQAVKSGQKNFNIFGEGGKVHTKAADGKIQGAVIAEFATSIVDRIVETSSLVEMFDRMPVGNTEFSLPITAGATGAALGASYTVGNGSIVWNKASFCLGSAKPVLSDNQINDAFFPVLPWIQKQISEDFGTLFAQQAIGGKGAGEEMKGFGYFFDKTKITDAARGTEYFKVVDLSAETDYSRYDLIDQLNKLVLDLPTKFKNADTCYVMNRTAYLLIASLRDETGRPLLERSAADANVMTLNGFPVVYDLLLPDTAPVMFGNFKEAYTLLTLENSLTFKVNEWQLDGMTCFPSSFRVGGVVKSNHAVIGLALPTSVKKA